MPVLDILVYPDPALKRKSLPVTKFSEDVVSLLDDMAQTMRDADGVGLAAPQVGKNIRVILIDVPLPEEDKREFYELINPEIVSSRGFQIGEEGCLSVPGFFANIRRKEHVRVSALDRRGKRFTIDADGMLSRVLQHEIDHLDGILFFDRLRKLKRDLLVKQINERFVSARG
ncbi:MAG: peptide deformylase [Candidatus Dadabacteria bacterium]|nr:peptide deformylase [Candidatus Dadabacteria bacterium]MYA47756.1 peptide deformylase [Candidatus Dadabacteria bacterium]MYF48489.1 peptide deformylase [Candidatus Dadabacteria bacterium]MYG82321.1 peptide deformylase [Candidatus Dadabacteria bacterium]MYK50076.1 peptide deformylase [Candidatus Dadabacteria bacterium]